MTMLLRPRRLADEPENDMSTEGEYSDHNYASAK